MDDGWRKPLPEAVSFTGRPACWTPAPPCPVRRTCMKHAEKARKSRRQSSAQKLQGEKVPELGNRLAAGDSYHYLQWLAIQV